MFENEKLTILYGSQTGNAQDLSERIWRESKRFYFISIINSMENYNILDLIHEKCVIFVCSTTGQGEEPDNMKSFWKFLLRKNLPTNSLQFIRFAVLGLGDSSYAKFNFVAKRLHKRLLQLGGQSVIELGLGDDQHDLGYDAVADPWIESLWNKLLMLYPLPNCIQPLEKKLTIFPRWNIMSKSVNDNVGKLFNNKNQPIYYSTKKSNEFYLKMIQNQRITCPNHFQDVRIIKFETCGNYYSPGDIIVLRPKNLKWQVNKFIQVLKSNGVNISGDTIIKLSESNQNISVPMVLENEVTFQQLCEEYFDLMSIPRRYTFNILAQLTDSELEREKCLEFTTSEGQNDLYSYCNRPKRNIVEVLQDFPGATKKLTIEMLFELLQPIKPREFSIASSYSTHINEIHILLAVVKYKTKLTDERFGLCSNYLADLKIGDELLGSLKKGSFIFPKLNDKNSPVIMIGPGTGIAPFRNFIFECVQQGVASATNLLLFFGCRNRNSDFHCKEEFLQLENTGKIRLITAFSRETKQKEYVQHKILENQELVWNFLKRNASIFIAGNAKLMPQEVRNAFVQVCKGCGGMTQIKAENFIEKLEKSNKLQTECWS